MRFALRDDLYFCVVDHRVIFLDIQSDRYFSLSKETDTAFQKLIRYNELSASDLDALSPMIDSGLLVRGQTPIQMATGGVMRPTRSLLDDSDFATDGFGSLHAIATRIITNTLLQQLPLAASICHVRHVKRQIVKRGRHISKPNFGKLIEGFVSTKRIIPTQDKCLPWSIAMVKFLATYNHFPMLVIGVKAQPFGAHAWVQNDTIVLNDYLDNVMPYTPILAV